MHRSTIIAAALAVGLVGASLHAEDRGTGTMGRPGETGTMERDRPQRDDARTGTTTASSALTGVVRNIDRQDGEVTVESQGRQMELELPPTALGDLQTGDQVAINIRRTGKAGTGMQHGDAPATGKADRPGMHGVVRNVDADDGQLTIESQGTKYDVTLTPAAVRDIQEGDQVALTIQKSGSRGSTQHGDAPAKR